MLNHKTIFKQKSKIFITILCIFGLLFSYSCKCRNQISDPNNIPLDNGITNKKPDETTPESFSVKADLQSANFMVGANNKQYGSSDIKIVLDSDGKEYTAKIISIEDITEGKTDKLELTEGDYEYAKDTGLVTIKESGLNKIGALNSENAPDDRKVNLTLEVKATDTTLQNNSTNIIVEVHLIKVQIFTETTFQNNIKTFQSANIVNRDDDSEVARFKYEEFANGVMKVKQSDDSDPLQIPKARIKTNIIDRLNRSGKGIKSAKEVDGDTIEGGGSATESIKFKVELEFEDNYDGSAITNPITVEVSIITGGSWVD